MNLKIKNIYKKNLSPLPLNINTNWNLGSTLFLLLILQIMSGLLLTLIFIPNSHPFMTFLLSKNNINLFFLLNTMHFIITSIIFIFLYLHLLRNIKNHSFQNKTTWSSGFLMLFLFMLNAFLGYTLPWGQMSLWAATVITNLMTIIPILGDFSSMLIWGDYSMTVTTLTRFFSMHYLIPILILLFAFMHIFLLHTKGSYNNLPLTSNMEKISLLHFLIKDTMFWIFTINIMILILMLTPNIFLESENFKQANPMSTPPHIKPEWYFLFAYCILRSIPNKMLGILLFLLSLLVPLMMIFKKNKINNFITNPITKIYTLLLIFSFIFLTYLGAKIVEPPFSFLSLILSFFYFLFLTLMFFP